MQSLDNIKENAFICSLTKCFEHPDYQVNKLHESDAEILALPQTDSDTCLAVTTDSIVEEIETGLYDSPYLCGWMAVMANLSDLAAVGAEPLGLLLSQTFPKDEEQSRIMLLQKGINDACKKAGTYILGGDISSSDKMFITGTALGIIDRQKLMTRRGSNAGDIVFSSSLLGAGNGFALSKFSGLDNLRLNYLPVARLTESKLIRNYSSSCMDTSDGLIASLDQLMRINNIGFSINSSLDSIICPESLSIANKAGIPEWLLLAGQHGEFELLFTIPVENLEKFLDDSSKIQFNPIRLGIVTETQEINLNIDGRQVRIDSEWIRNLTQSTKSVQEYISALMSYNESFQK
jgi:thiamine-monophosphate kinase